MRWPMGLHRPLPVSRSVSRRGARVMAFATYRTVSTPFTETGAGLHSDPRTATARTRSWRFRMNRPTAIIAEDEPLLRGELKDALAELWPEVEIKAEVE